MRKRVLLYSRLAFYPMHWEAFKIICEKYDIDPFVITTSYTDIPEVHKMLGWADPTKDKEEGFAPKIYFIRQGNFLMKTWNIWKNLKEIRPDVVWAQEEPTASFSIPLLLYYLFDRKTLLVTALNENIFSLPFYKKIFFKMAWKRWNTIISTNSLSTKALRDAGMPEHIPAYNLVCGCLPPPSHITPLEHPFISEKGNFIIGFAGRITEVKGWKYLIEALRLLPENFKCLFAGSGDELEALQTVIKNEDLKDRISYVGLLTRENLWKFYKSLDCLAVPSITTKKWKEQTGGVVQDAMAIGIPIVGSNSGGIPEVLGDAGIIVPEADSGILAEAIKKIHDNKELKEKLQKNGIERFEEIFTITSYAKRIAEGLDLHYKEHICAE